MDLKHCRDVLLGELVLREDNQQAGFAAFAVADDNQLLADLHIMSTTP